MMLNNCFFDKKIWIIGASEGIGEAVARKLDLLGAKLFISSRSFAKLEKLGNELSKKPELVVLDVSNYENFSSNSLLILTENKFDYILYFPAFYEPLELINLANEVLYKTINTNLCAVFYLFEILLPYLRDNQNCKLAVTASIAGYIGLPFSQPYAATKAAVINLVESAKAENLHIDIKLINPGFVSTRLTEKNHFKMPALISPEKAACFIINGLLKNKFEIHFPKRMSIFLKIIKWLPYTWYFFFLKKIIKKQG